MPGAVAKKKRREELSEEDEFLNLLDAASAWIQLHTRTVIAGAVAIVLLVGGVLYYRGYRESLKTRAAIELSQLRGTLSVADAIPELTGFVARFDGTPAAKEGRLLLARLQLRVGQPRIALGILEPLASEPVDQPNGYAAATLLAEAYKNAGEHDRALAKLDEIARDAYVPYQRHRALAEKGRLLAALGRYEEAAEAYRQLVEDEEAADDVYRVRLGEIESLIASGADAPATAFASPPTGATDPIPLPLPEATDYPIGIPAADDTSASDQAGSVPPQPSASDTAAGPDVGPDSEEGPEAPPEP